MCRLAFKIVLPLLAACAMTSCLGSGSKKGPDAAEEPRYLVRITDGEEDTLSVPFYYVNEKGDTVVRTGEYAYGYHDTIVNYGIVLTHEGECLAIDRDGEVLYKVFWYDNGPDYIEGGLFRIEDEEGNIGFASGSDGRVVIEPRFAFANVFEGDSTLVADDGYMIYLGEYSYWDSDDWYYIDKEGYRLSSPAEITF